MLSGAAFIIEAGSGFGQSAAYSLAQHGVRQFALVDTNEAGLQETVRKLASQYKVTDVPSVSTECSTEETIEAAVQQAGLRFERIDFAVNNAGFDGPMGGSPDTAPAAFEAHLKDHVTLLWLWHRAELQQMLRQGPRNGRYGRGSIVHVCSVHVFAASPPGIDTSAYVAGRHAILDLFSQKYGKEKFELITVKNMREPGAFDDAVSGVSGIAHVASVRSMDATAKEPSVKRFVLTSSSAAVRSLQAYRETDTVSVDEYDEQILALSKNIPDALPPMHKFMIAYFASKVAAEQAFWEWAKNNKPHFSVNAVLPCTIYGGPLDVTHQGFPSTAKIPLQILDGDTDSIKHVQRIYYVHVQDVARLHVAGLIHPTTSGEGIFAFAASCSINEVFDIFAKAVPGYKTQEKLAGLDFPLAEIGPRGKAEALLKDMC